MEVNLSALLRSIWSSRQPPMLVLKGLLALALVLAELTGIVLSIQPLLPPQVYQKDFVQEYLMARAVAGGLDPYLPLDVLGAHIFGQTPVPVMPHPTPHPPPVALLSLPLVLLSYQQAAAVWYIIELACMALAVYGILRLLNGRTKARHALAVTLLLFMWSPFKDELAVGQLTSLILALLVGVWYFLRGGRQAPAGLLLGLVMALKLFAWPVGLYLLLRKQWRAAAAAGLTWLGANVAAGAVIGFGRLFDYYLATGPSVSGFYQSHERNFALWSVGYRLFVGMRSDINLMLEAPALFAFPAAARWTSLALLAGFVGLGLYLALRSATLDGAFSLLVCVSLLANPVAWNHYLILALIPGMVVLKWLSRARLSQPEKAAAGLAGILVFNSMGLRSLVLLAVGVPPSLTETVQISFWTSLVTLLPAAAVLSLFWLVWRLDKTSAQKGEMVKKLTMSATTV